ncbi:MAG: protein-glutamate O-methyltransferase CheR [Candidatus Delongbacteria bacterium]|nr:protein-glutamate O-methyltransferase CheR [Candidatus Delongbacteria bacterium]MBN2836405.1 protein-glutamate O-methyltransferase CheR [Candidatus Delongbacteria bacterium]
MDNIDFKNDLLSSIGINDEEFYLLKSYIHKHFGINLTTQKKSLLIGRLQKVIKDKALNSFNDYYNFLINDSTGKAASELINKISTNHTYFNREKAHFEYYVNYALPDVLNNNSSTKMKDIRIWCAASSTGEEPYMLTILQHELSEKIGKLWDIGLLATDISIEVLNIAKNGIYETEKLTAMPKRLIQKYMHKFDSSSYQMNDNLRNQIVFRRFNLMNDFPFKSQFDIIFARNVMIYFDQQTRDKLINKFYNFLKPGGYLFIGHSETLNRATNKFISVNPAVYQKQPE